MGHALRNMQGNRGMQGKCMGMHPGRGMQAHRPMQTPEGLSHALMMAMRQPAVREQIKVYREKNIFPVIRAQREAFDKVLTKKEKKVIAEARNRMQALRNQRMQMRSQGARLSDSARLAMQQQMDKDRVAVRGILLKHYSTLQKAMNPIKEKMPQWRNDIRKIVADYVVEQQMQRMAGKYAKTHPMLKEKGAMMFLMMDPAHPENNAMFRMLGIPKK